MPEGILFWLVAGLAILIVSFSKGGFAGGGAIAGVPLMSIVIDPITAAGIMLPLLILIDAISVWAYRGKWSLPIFKTMIPGAIVGIGLGALTFEFIHEDALRLLLGVIVFGFIAFRWFRRAANAAAPPAAPSYTRGGFLAGIGGFTSTVAHAGQPPVAMYMLPLKQDRTTYQATNVLLFAAINYVKILPYGLLGMLDTSNLMTSAMLAPLVPIGTLAGVWLHHRISDRLFINVVYVSLVFIGGKLIYDGVMGLMG